MKHLRLSVIVVILAALALSTVTIQATWPANSTLPQTAATRAPSDLPAPPVEPTQAPPPVQSISGPITGNDLETAPSVGETELQQFPAVPGASMMPIGGCQSMTSVNGSIRITDPVMKGRLYRDSISASCLTPKASQTTLNPGDSYHYQAYEYTNTSSNDTCYTVDIGNVSNCNFNLSVATYLNSFNPDYPSVNYLADPGASPADGGNLSYSFYVPAGAKFIVVANNVTGATSCGGYTLNVRRCSCVTRSEVRSITSSTENGRTFRDGIPSSCTAAKMYPGIYGAGTLYYYDWTKLTNPTAQNMCMGVKIKNLCNTAGAMPFTTAYLNSYNPAIQSANYLADIGSSPTTNGSEKTFSFTVPPKKDVILVTTEAFASTCSQYQMDVTTCSYQVCNPYVGR